MTHQIKTSLSILLISILILIICFTSNGQRIIVETWNNGQEKVTFDITKGTGEKPIDYYYFKFYPNGQVYKEGNYIDEKYTGEWKFYYQNGNTKSIGNYRRGNLVGKFKSYYITGEIEQDGMYQVGQLANVKLYNRDGTEKERNEDLSYLISEKVTPWTSTQKARSKVDCLMPIDGVFEKADDYCTCIIDSTAKHIKYENFRYLSEYQRSLIFKYLMEQRGCCRHLIEK
ncbi:MAG: hypothetical protein U9R19_06090 [Bacteroidota bacterium]|nr:hypothetical protein [Bacteroidota bacterium]